MVLTENQKIIIRSWLGDVTVDEIIAFFEAEPAQRVATLVAYARDRSLKVVQSQEELDATAEKLAAEAAAMAELLTPP